jgi:hypothetical protein
LITGPEEIVSKFVNYANEEGFASYWQAIEKLMEDASKLTDINS